MKVPKILLRLGRYGEERGRAIQPRHILLVLALANRKFQDKPIRAYWEELARDLGVKRDTVRKWAYQLDKMGLLRMTANRGRDPLKNRPGVRNERNTFHLQPFIGFLREADARWSRQPPKPEERNE